METNVVLSADQRVAVQNLVSQKNYASGYLYVANIVSGQAGGDPRTARWLETAASINSNDGSWHSDFVHYATYQALRDQGLPVSPDVFSTRRIALPRPC
jgi:hypothetical protein